MKSPLLSVAASELKPFLLGYRGTQLHNLPTLPYSFSLQSTKNGYHIKGQFLYQDFKEAFSQFNLVAGQCAKLHYYPQIFNVYNKVIVACGSKDSNDTDIITTKDLFMVHFISFLRGEASDQAIHQAFRSMKTSLLL